MRKINFTGIKPSASGSLDPGGYVCEITSATDVPEKEYVKVLIEIAEGDRKGYFGASGAWDSSHSLYFSYKDSALSMLLGRLDAITASNPGFDARAAFEGGHEELLVGKLVGVEFREEEYYNKNDDEFEIGRPRPDRLVPADDVRQGRVKAQKPKMLKDDQKVRALQRAGFSDAADHLREMQLGGDVPSGPMALDPDDAYDLPF